MNQEERIEKHLANIEALKDKYAKMYEAREENTELPLEIELAAEAWADSQFPEIGNAELWLAARNGYRGCYRDLQAAKEE